MLVLKQLFTIFEAHCSIELLWMPILTIKDAQSNGNILGYFLLKQIYSNFT